MKTATTQSFCSFFLFVLSVLIAGPALAQQQPQRLGGNLIKTGTYNGRQIQYVARQIAVKRAPSATRAQAAQVAQPYNAAVLKPFDKLGWSMIELPKGRDVFPVISALEQSPLIEVAEPNGVTRTHVKTNSAPNNVAVSTGSNDPYYDGTSPASYAHQWALNDDCGVSWKQLRRSRGVSCRLLAGL